MHKFWSRNEESALGDELRARRPEPSTEFVRSLAQRVETDRRRVPRRSFRPALAVAFTAMLVLAFGVFGGAGYASSMKQQVSKVVQVFESSHSTSAPTVANNNSQSSNKSGGDHGKGGGDNGGKGGGDNGGKGGGDEGGHHGGGGGDDDGGDDDQYKPGKGCGDNNHVHDKHNECKGHGRGHGH